VTNFDAFMSRIWSEWREEGSGESPAELRIYRTGVQSTQGTGDQDYTVYILQR